MNNNSPAIASRTDSPRCTDCKGPVLHCTGFCPVWALCTALVNGSCSAGGVRLAAAAADLRRCERARRHLHRHLRPSRPQASTAAPYRDGALLASGGRRRADEKSRRSHRLVSFSTVLQPGHTSAHRMRTSAGSSTTEMRRASACGSDANVVSSGAAAAAMMRLRCAADDARVREAGSYECACSKPKHVIASRCLRERVVSRNCCCPDVSRGDKSVTASTRAAARTQSQGCPLRAACTEPQTLGATRIREYL